MGKILVTGAFGQIGSELVPALAKEVGKDSVVAIAHKTSLPDFPATVIQADVEDRKAMDEIFSRYQFDQVYHLVSLLSATGELNPDKAWSLNLLSLKYFLDKAKEHKFRFFWPSSIAVFGPSTPKDATPQHTIIEPTTMYGVTKLAGENLCHYYHLKYGVDVRSVRYPGLISWKTPPGGGTSDYAVAIFYDGIKTGKYQSFVRKDTTIPMMYMDDAIRATRMLMEADPSSLTIRTSYNLAAVSFSVEELATEVNKHLPVEVSYAPDHRQAIADSWPNSIDDSQARQDWGWNPDFDLAALTKEMIINLSPIMEAK